MTTVEHTASMAAIAAAVARHFSLSQADLMGRSRLRTYAHARQLAMTLCLDLAEASIPEVAAYFGRDRATVYYAAQITRGRVVNDAASPLALAWRAVAQAMRDETGERCARHRWHDVDDASAEPVVAMIGHWPGAKLMQIGSTYACQGCEALVTIEAAAGGAAQVRWKGEHLETPTKQLAGI